MTKKIKEYNELVQDHVDDNEEVDLCELIIENEQNAMAQKIFDEKALFKDGKFMYSHNFISSYKDIIQLSFYPESKFLTKPNRWWDWIHWS